MQRGSYVNRGAGLGPVAILPLSLALIIAPQFACGGAHIERDGLQVRESSWQEADRDVRRRASYELRCPETELQLRLLETRDGSFRARQEPQQIGVEGCGARVVYVEVFGSGWVMNTQSEERAQ